MVCSEVWPEGELIEGGGGVVRRAATGSRQDTPFVSHRPFGRGGASIHRGEGMSATAFRRIPPCSRIMWWRALLGCEKENIWGEPRKEAGDTV